MGSGDCSRGRWDLDAGARGVDPVCLPCNSTCWLETALWIASRAVSCWFRARSGVNWLEGGVLLAGFLAYLALLIHGA